MHYASYGGRGIKVSEEFLNPIAFIDYMRSVGDVGDVGEAFRQKLEIDRIDNERGYERGNLRWATRATQNNNKQSTLYVEYAGERMCFTDFVQKHTSLSRSRAYTLYHEGRSLDEIARVQGRGPRGPSRQDTGL